MKKIPKTPCFIVFIIILVAFVTIVDSYSEPPVSPEEEFKRCALEFKELLGSFDPDAKDYRSQLRALDTPSQRLPVSLKAFIKNNPESAYADDAVYLVLKLAGANPESALREAREFLSVFPKASLERWTLDNLGTLMIVEKEIGVRNAVRLDMVIALYDMKKNEEVIREAEELIRSINAQTLSDKGGRALGLVYYYLVISCEGVGNSERARSASQEAIEKLPSGVNTEGFRRILSLIEQ